MKISQDDVCRLADISKRQLRYWRTKGYVNLRKSDREHIINMHDMFMFVAIGRLRSFGFSIQSIAKNYLRFLELAIYGYTKDEAVIAKGFEIPPWQTGLSMFLDESDKIIVCDSSTIFTMHKLRHIMSFEGVVDNLETPQDSSIPKEELV